MEPTDNNAALHARLAQLERDNAILAANVSTLRSTNAALVQRLAWVQHTRTRARVAAYAASQPSACAGLARPPVSPVLSAPLAPFSQVPWASWLQGRASPHPTPAASQPAPLTHTHLTLPSATHMAAHSHAYTGKSGAQGRAGVAGATARGSTGAKASAGHVAPGTKRDSVGGQRPHHARQRPYRHRAGKLDAWERTLVEEFLAKMKAGTLEAPVVRGTLASRMRRYVNPDRLQVFYEKLVSRRGLNTQLADFLFERTPKPGRARAKRKRATTCSTSATHAASSGPADDGARVQRRPRTASYGRAVAASEA